MPDNRIIGKAATLSTATISPTRTSVISREPGIEPATMTVQRAGTIEPSEPGIEDIAPSALQTAGIASEVLGEDCQPLAGRARSPTTTGTRLVELWTQVNNAVAVNPTAVNALDTEVVNGVSQYLREPRLWAIRTFANETLQSTGAGGAAPAWGSLILPVLTVAQNCGVARAYSGRSWLHARVRWEAPGTHGTFDMDLGGSPIEIYANSVKVNIIVPAFHQEILEGVINPWIAGAWSLSARTDAFLEILPIEGSRGDSKTTLTMRQEAAANTQIGFEIPAYAKAVTIYQAGAGAASVAWTFELGAFGGANSSIEVGTIPFIAGVRRTDQVEIVPGATYIMSDIDVANARLFTAVWEIEP